jgi:RNA exonuclease 1
MVGSTFGSVLARVAMVGSDGETLLDIYVRPEGRVLDYRTRKSQIDAETMRREEEHLLSAKEARERVFNFLREDTILVGHSLESDLMSLRIVHYMIIDTSIVFPHPASTPNRLLKHGLAKLVFEHIRWFVPKFNNHDPISDALAPMYILQKHARRFRDI